MAKRNTRLKYLSSATAGLMLSCMSQLASAAPAIDFSLWLGQVDTSHSGKIPYVQNDDNGNVVNQNLGHGSSYGLAFGINLTPEWVAGIQYDQFLTKKNGKFDTDPSTSTDCNALPLQGSDSDCYDTSNIRIKTKFQNVDLTMGHRFSVGTASLVGYGGAQYVRLNQTIDTSYLYPTGNEQFANREVKYSGWGPKLGIKGTVPIGTSDFFVKGDFSLAKMLSGSREQTQSATVTSSGVFLFKNEASAKDKIRPLIVDVALELGYNLTRTSLLSLGWRYQEVSDVIDTRDTNDPAVAGTLPGSNGIGDKSSALKAQGLFLKFNQSF